MENDEPKRIIYLDILRIVATFAVVVLHTSGQGLSLVKIRTLEWNVYNCYDSVVRFSVPVFVMISGALFLDVKRKITVKEIYQKNVKRIFFSYFFWSVFYAAFYPCVKYILCGQFEQDVASFANQVIKGHFYMWFLPMMIGIYIIIPLLKKITEDSFCVKLFLVLAFIFAFVIPEIAQLLHAEILKVMLNKMEFHLSLGYSSYFILGYYLSKKEISFKEEICVYVLGILGFLSTILISAWVTDKTGVSYGHYGNFTLNVLFQSISVFVFFKNRIDKLQVNRKIESLITHISKYSFGVYLVHILILECLDGIGFNSTTFGAIGTVPVMSIVIFVISLGISCIINHIPILKNYIV